MAKRPGKHSAPLSSGNSRRGAHSMPFGDSSTPDAQAYRSSSADSNASKTSTSRSHASSSASATPAARTSRARAAREGAGNQRTTAFTNTPAARTSRARAAREGATLQTISNGRTAGAAPSNNGPNAMPRSYSTNETLSRARAARKKSIGKRIAIGVAAALAVVLVGGGAAVALYLNNINSTIQSGTDTAEFQELKEMLAPEKEDGSYYVAIFGSDARKGETISRSDVIMLAYIDSSEGVAELISVPRDTMIEIEGHGTQKINAAYAFGGPSKALTTLSTFAGVPISHYVEVHFEELQDVVNELGGIEVYVPERFYSDSSGLTIEKGEQTLNGTEALAFARERHATRAGDFSRAQAQRIIVEGIVQKVLSESITAIPGTVESLARCVTTDMSVTDLISLALTFKDRGLTMYSAACPSYTLNQNGVSYVGTQYEEWQDMMRRVDAGLDPNDTSVEIPEPQASSTELGAATNARSPKDYQSLRDNAMTTDDVIQIDETASAS